MENKLEYWRNQTLVNRTSTNTTVAVEYYTLAKFIMNNYKDRMETIQNPLLHIISHCLELTLKEVIIFAIDNNYINKRHNTIIHEHNLEKLVEILLLIFHKISIENYCSPEDKDLFSNKIPTKFNRIVDILKTETTTYRYAEKLDKQGKTVGKGHPFINDGESANILELKNLFEDCYSAICYTDYVLNYMFPEQEME